MRTALHKLVVKIIHTLVVTERRANFVLTRSNPQSDKFIAYQIGFTKSQLPENRKFSTETEHSVVKLMRTQM